MKNQSVRAKALDDLRKLRAELAEREAARARRIKALDRAREIAERQEAKLGWVYYGRV
jgi:hypothetical protein